MKQEMLHFEDVSRWLTTEEGAEHSKRIAFAAKIFLLISTLIIVTLLLTLQQQGGKDEVLMYMKTIKKSDWTLIVDQDTMLKSEGNENTIPSKVILHSFHTEECRTNLGCIKTLQGIERSSTTVNFWIGYHGTVFEDAGWTSSEKLIVSFLGNENYFPSAASLKVVADLLENGVLNGRLDKHYKISSFNMTDSAEKLPLWIEFRKKFNFE